VVGQKRKNGYPLEVKCDEKNSPEKRKEQKSVLREIGRGKEWLKHTAGRKIEAYDRIQNDVLRKFNTST